jgi:hypothetical protein
MVGIDLVKHVFHIQLVRQHREGSAADGKCPERGAAEFKSITGETKMIEKGLWRK